MGIKGLTGLIHRYAGNAVREYPLQHYVGQKMAIDASLVQHQYLVLDYYEKQKCRPGPSNQEDERLIQPPSHLFGFFADTVRMLTVRNDDEHSMFGHHRRPRRRGILPIYVFDGEAPTEKKRTTDARLAVRQRAASYLKETADQVSVVVSGSDGGNTEDVDDVTDRQNRPTGESSRPPIQQQQQLPMTTTAEQQSTKLVVDVRPNTTTTAAGPTSVNPILPLKDKDEFYSLPSPSLFNNSSRKSPQRRLSSSENCPRSTTTRRGRRGSSSTFDEKNPQAEPCPKGGAVGFFRRLFSFSGIFSWDIEERRVLSFNDNNENDVERVKLMKEYSAAGRKRFRVDGEGDGDGDEDNCFSCLLPEQILDSRRIKERELLRISPDHNQESKQLLRLMGIPFVEAPGEAEAQCATLVRQGLCFAAATEDMDALTFGSDVLIRNLNNKAQNGKGKAFEFRLNDILQGFKMTYEQFVDLCILTGCDYCSTVKNIGPIRALEYVRKYGSIEGMLDKEAGLRDTISHEVPDDFNYGTTRKLFFEPNVIRDDHVQLSENSPWTLNDLNNEADSFPLKVDNEGIQDLLIGEKGYSKEAVNGLLKLLNDLSSESKRATKINN